MCHRHFFFTPRHIGLPRTKPRSASAAKLWRSSRISDLQSKKEAPMGASFFAPIGAASCCGSQIFCAAPRFSVSTVGATLAVARSFVGRGDLTPPHSNRRQNLFCRHIHFSFFIFHFSFFIFHSSFFILHFSFFIFHSSFFILHFPFKKALSSRRELFSFTFYQSPPISPSSTAIPPPISPSSTAIPPPIPPPVISSPSPPKKSGISPTMP